MRSEPSIDGLVSQGRSSSLSGQTLFFWMGLGLTICSVMLDLITGHFLDWRTSLFVPFALSTLVSSLVGYWAIPQLVQIKAGQFIREDGPQTHLKKAGTPTMGGIFFVPVGVGFALLMSQFSPNVVAVCALTLAYGFIGWMDDWQILRRRSNKGISPRMKLGLQVGCAALFCLWVAWSQPDGISTVSLPFGLVLSLGSLFWPLAAFVLVAESNATNLTDGVDGLMGGLGAIAFLGLGAYLSSTSPELATFCACMSGGCLGFVSHNRNPAKVFMGDTGALALGGGLAAVAVLSNSFWVLLIISGIFLAETLSVIAQVSYYKVTKGPDGIGKRLFKMAPLHHHLELSGWPETQVVAWFYGINALLVLGSWMIH
ncbi:MAG: phospho-N-acetylmuramoyl-pentapeptide-transferase [Microcoleaceae cyanobacterium]